MLIDSHQHVFWHGKDDAGLVADLDQQGIEHAWLLSWEIPPDQDNKAYHDCLNPVHVRADGTHAGIPLNDLLLAKSRHPDRFVLGYCPDPRLASAPRLFESACNIHGVRVCGEWKFRMLLDDPRCLELFHAAGRLHCPVVLHLDVPYMADAQGNMVYQRDWYGGTVLNLERALQECPQTIFIGHAPGFWREISGDADTASGAYPQGPVQPGGRLHKLLDAYPNLYADLSAGSARIALARDPQHAKAFLTRYAPRLLFARDYYGSELMDFLKTLNLSQDVWELISHANATKLLRPAE